MSHSVTMSNRPIIAVEGLKTVIQGALGAMTFGAYHQYTTNRMMDLNNRVTQKEIDLNNQSTRKEIDELKSSNAELRKELEDMKRRKWW